MVICVVFYIFLSVYLPTGSIQVGNGITAGVGALDIAEVYRRVQLLSVVAAPGATLAILFFFTRKRFC